MRTSQKGINLLKRFEGLRLKAYRDSVGVWTIGYGHTSMAGPPEVTPGLRISAQEAEDILERDLLKYEKAVERAITRPMEQEQFDAMVSLCYNIGPGAFTESSIARKFNAGDIIGAANSFTLYNKAGKGSRRRVLGGLEARRRAERALFMNAAKTFESKPMLKHRRVKLGLMGIGGGYAAGAIGMFSGFDWLALVVLLGFISIWAIFFYIMYKKEIEEGLFK